MAKKRTEQQKLKLAYSLVFFAIAVFCSVAIIGKMATTMFVERSYWQEVSDYSIDWDVKIPARRGNILSDEGLLLSSSIPQYMIHFDFKSYEKNADDRLKDQTRKDTLFQYYIEPFVDELVALFPQYTKQQILTHYREKFNERSSYCTILPKARPISYNQYNALKDNEWLKPKYNNWFYSCEERVSRQKPYGELASRTIGDLYGVLDSAKNGLELSYDSLLRGKPGVGHQEKVMGITRIITDKPQIDGCDIITTLNVEMQDIAERALRRELEQLNAASGVAMVMEVKTGDIKAIANLTRLDNGSFMEIQNNAVKEYFEPGSTFKTVAMMVGMDEGKIQMDEKVYCHKGIYNGFSARQAMRDHNYRSGGYDTLTTTEILMYSSNIGIAKLIDKGYKDNPQLFVDAVKRTGIGNHFTMQLVGTASPVINRDGYWDATRLPWMATGYNLQLPVVNTLTFYNAIANNGKMVEPRLVKEVRRGEDVIEKIPVKVVNEQICKEKTLKDVQYMLEQVVSKGLAKQAGSTHFKAAGKTGTAQMGYGSNGRTTHMVSFCGYFPADNPQYTCIVSIRTSAEMGGAASGGGMAGPVFHEISEKIMATKLFKDVEMAIDSSLYVAPKVLNGNLQKVQIVLDELDMDAEWDGVKYSKRDSIWGSTRSDSTTVTIKAGDYITPGLVPNVVGMGAQDALYLLESVGLKVKINGVGRVRQQSLRAGTRFNSGSTIVLTLRM